LPRKLIRPSLPHHASTGPRGQRKPAPPETTSAEASYLVQAIESRARLTVHLVGGQVVEGILEFYDRDVLKLEPRRGPKLLVRRDKIKYYRAERPSSAKRGRERSAPPETGEREGKAAPRPRRKASPRRRR